MGNPSSDWFRIPRKAHNIKGVSLLARRSRNKLMLANARAGLFRPTGLMAQENQQIRHNQSNKKLARFSRSFGLASVV